MKEIWLNSFNNTNLTLLTWLLLPITAYATLNPVPVPVSKVPLLGEESSYTVDYPVNDYNALQAPSMLETRNIPPDTDKTLLDRYFSPTVASEMYRIATCESSNRMFDENGKVVTHKNDNGSIDYGYMQDNSSHEQLAQSYNLDYKNNLEDNIHLAKIIYDQQGYGAWMCSHGII